jgi:PAS domain S-box-containing protein
MSSLQKSAQDFFWEEIHLLFYQRTLICLWLAVIFFSLFALLDFVYCPDQFGIFLFYRLFYVVIILTFINLLKLPSFMRFAPRFIYAAMNLGALTISLMTVRLGGFHSGYYVGILLMIAGALSVLPLRASQAVFTGLSMYFVYIMTVILGSGGFDRVQLVYAINNSFFFLALVVVAAIQSFDDLRTLLKAFRVKKNIHAIRVKLAEYTDSLEETVQQRLADLQETELKYRDLYDNIMDLVVLIDGQGIIQQFNRHWTTLHNIEPKALQKADIRNFLWHEEGQADWLAQVLRQLAGGGPIQGMQLNLRNTRGESLEVELSASRVEIDAASYFQLILRDISATKKIERNLLDSERLIGTSRQAAIFGLARLAECRDGDTGLHLSRIRAYTHILAEELAKLPEFSSLITRRFVGEIGHSAVLHDIGKVGIPDAILQKPGKLTKEEFELMKKHTIFGSDVLALADEETDNLSFLNLGRQIVRSHHERWDAGGYPDGLSGAEIPLAARIIALADVYDALTSHRVYKPPFSHEESKAIIAEESGKQFDPRVVNAFLSREEDFKKARMNLLVQQQMKQVRQQR